MKATRKKVVYFDDVKIFCQTDGIFRRIFFSPFLFPGATPWRSWLRHYATSRKVAGSIPDCVALWPWGRLVSNLNEYQGYFLGGEGGRYIG
jgi:hypothetical protein